MPCRAVPCYAMSCTTHTLRKRSAAAEHVNIGHTLSTSRGGKQGPKAKPIRQHMAIFILKHVHRCHAGGASHHTRHRRQTMHMIEQMLYSGTL